MPDRDQHTPPVTPAERTAQLILTYVLIALEAAQRGLAVVLAILPQVPDAELERIGDREIPDTLTNAIRGSAECAASDHLEPAIRTLQEAATATPETLRREWLELQEKGR